MMQCVVWGELYAGITYIMSVKETPKKRNQFLKKNAIIIFFVGVDSPSVDCPTPFKDNRRYRFKTGHKWAETAWFSVLSTNWVIMQNWKVLSHWPPLIASFYCLLHSVECGQKCFCFHLLPHITVMWGCQEHSPSVITSLPQVENFNLWRSA